MIKAVIFDLDGTLIDADPYWKEADYLFAKDYPFPLTELFRGQLSGLGIKESAKLFIQTFSLNETLESFIIKRKKYLYQILFQNLKLMPFARELIEKLQKNNFILALATAGHDVEKTNEILIKLSIANYFTFVISGTEMKHNKPAPDIYLYTIKKMGMSLKECLVIEDTVNGVLAGKRAGLKVIGVNNNKDMKERLKETGADLTYQDLNISIKIFNEFA